jgi:hypothetical protein
MDGEAKHTAAGGGDFTGMVQCAEVGEELLGASEGFLVRAVHPAKAREMAHPGCF